MDYQIGLVVGAAALGLLMSLRFSVIAFSLVSFGVALGCLLFAVIEADSFGFWRAFAIWMLFNVCYVVGGVFLPFSVFRRDTGSSKPSSPQVYPNN